MGEPVPTKPRPLRLRRLASELLRLRTEANLSREDVAKQTAINEATLYRIERGGTRPQRRTLIALLDLYGTVDPQRGELLDLLRTSPADERWLRPYHAELPEQYTTYIGFESEAQAIRNYESLFIPGLFQTEDYVRAMVRGLLPTATTKDVDQRVQVRMERQELLTKPDPLRIWAIVDEAALHRIVGGPSVMRAQMERLVTLAAEPHVTLQVISFAAGAHPGMPGSFVLVDFPDPADKPAVYIDSMAGDLFLEADSDIQRYSAIFDHLRAIALGPGESTHLIGTLASELA